jgi:uncharacterized protein (TIGR01777 family)
MKVVLAGGSGALGRRLAADLTARGHEVVVLTRTPDPAAAHRQVEWDGRTLGPWAEELAGAALVNLAGVLVDRRPTRANVELLTRSRVEPTLALAAAPPPEVWVQMSTVAIYGDGGEQVLTESSPPAAAQATAGRQVVLRTGIVLDRGTPALDRLTGLVRLGLGGRIGSGRQWVSWLHAEDFLAIVRRALEDPVLAGVVHATSPEPVRNAELMATLRRVLHRPPAPPTPAALVRLGAPILRTDPALALLGRRAVPARLLDLGHQFLHPSLPEALDDLLGGG